ncbi:MAG: hypothetical protein HJHJAOHD_02524 [Flavobacteriales bacterium]|nr:hypothetical protein [Flavobacteriales bacterium]
MKRLILLLYCFIFLIGSCALKKKHGSNVDEDFIPWSESYKLSWSDYLGTPDYSAHDAVTWVSYQTRQIGLREDAILFDIRCYFIKSKSWKRPNVSNNLLKHEQLHFDIAEIFIRKVRKEFSNFISYEINVNNSINELGEIRDIILEEKRNFSFMYDQETNFSKNKEKQKEWEKKIKTTLKEYEQYANPYVEVKREP